MATESPLALMLHGVHIAEYPPAGAGRQHEPLRVRRLLAHAKEIVRMATEMRAKGASLVPLKLYFVRGKAKVLVGIAMGKKKADKRQAIREREERRDIDRAMRRRR